MSEPHEALTAEQQAQRALDHANEYFEMVDHVYPKALDLSVEFGKLALGFAELVPLTARQIYLLDGLSHGMTKGEAAAAVDVKNFPTSEITSALGVQTVNQAVIRAYELGLLPPYKKSVQLDDISAAEMKIWLALTRGESRREIAKASNITIETVSSHLGKIYEKTGAATQIEAVRIGLETGITGVEVSEQGQINRAMMAASTMTAIRLEAYVPVASYPEEINYSELPFSALAHLIRGSKTRTYAGNAKKILNFNRLSEISIKGEDNSHIKRGDITGAFAEEKTGTDQPVSPKDDSGVEAEGPTSVAETTIIEEKTAREKLAELPEGERAVAFLIAAGFSNPEIAERLDLSSGTVLTYASTARSFLGVKRNLDLAKAIGPVTLEELPTEKKREKGARSISEPETTTGKKFMWEDEYDKQLDIVVKSLASHGVDAQTLIPVTEGNQPALELLTREGHIPEGAKMENLDTLDLITAMMLKTYQGKHLRAGAEWKPTARRKIREAIEKQWPQKQ
jgi:DNA-binding NarL/FixJ family response regulator